jgi:hypothetical protein
MHESLSVKGARWNSPLERARSGILPLPEIPEAPDAEHGWRLLAAVCRELQRAAGHAVFFIATRDAMRIVSGTHPMDGKRSLEALEDFGVIRCLIRGDPFPGGKASRFRYLLQIPPIVATER